MTAATAKTLPPSSWPKNPEYIIDFETVPARVRAILNGETIADSKRAKVMWELGHAPVYYFPREDVRMDLLRRTEHHTHCPYKGDASYWSLRARDRYAENAVWSYEEPYAEMVAIKDYLGFYWDRLDAWYEDERQVSAPRDIDGRIGADNNFAALHPHLAKQWHPERNPRLKPYEFGADSQVKVWWRDASGREWRQTIGERVMGGSQANDKGKPHRRIRSSAREAKRGSAGAFLFPRSVSVPTRPMSKGEWAEEALAWMKQHTPHSDTHVFKGHMSFWAEPEPFNAALDSFLAKMK